MSATSFEDHDYARSEGLGVIFIAGWSRKNVRVFPHDPVELIAYEDKNGARYGVYCGWGGGQDGYKTFVRPRPDKSRRSFKGLPVWRTSLHEAQEDLNLYASKRRWVTFASAFHPNCVARAYISGANRQVAEREQLLEIGQMAFEQFVECYPDGCNFWNTGTLKYAESRQVNLYREALARLAMSGLDISDRAVLSFLTLSDVVRDNSYWGCGAGDSVGEVAWLQWLEHREEIGYLGPRRKKEAWEWLSPRRKAEGRCFHRYAEQARRLWGQVLQEQQLAA